MWYFRKYIIFSLTALTILYQYYSGLKIIYIFNDSVDIVLAISVFMNDVTDDITVVFSDCGRSPQTKHPPAGRTYNFHPKGLDTHQPFVNKVFVICSTAVAGWAQHCCLHFISSVLFNPTAGSFASCSSQRHDVSLFQEWFPSGCPAIQPRSPVQPQPCSSDRAVPLCI